MGTSKGRSSSGGLAGALFTPVQQRVLGLLFGQPERRFQSAEIIRLAAGGTGAAHRQLQKLEKVGLLLATREGSQKYYQANPESPIFPELHGLAVKTVGLAEPLRRALAPLAKKIELAFVFGSVAKGTERAKSDIDLLVVSDEVGYGEIYEAILPAEAILGRPINPTVRTRVEWRQALATKDSFAVRISQQARIFVIGEPSAAA
ncbi:MAG: nucleotidyltransferase domain-containing protein [Thermoanaerobaculia bacterium]